MSTEQQWWDAVLTIADECAAAAQWREKSEPGDNPADVHVAHAVRVIESDLRALVARLADDEERGDD